MIDNTENGCIDFGYRDAQNGKKDKNNKRGSKHENMY